MAESAPLWERVADALYFIDNPAALAQIADRFETPYRPTIADATTSAARAKAVEALSHYLASGATPHKQWSLTRDEAERALVALVALADEGV
jgi:hypothetical protein